MMTSTNGIRGLFQTQLWSGLVSFQVASGEKRKKKTVSNSGASVIVMNYMECRNTTKNGADNTCPLTASLE